MSDPERIRCYMTFHERHLTSLQRRQSYQEKASLSVLAAIGAFALAVLKLGGETLPAKGGLLALLVVTWFLFVVAYAVWLTFHAMQNAIDGYLVEAYRRAVEGLLKASGQSSGPRAGEPDAGIPEAPKVTFLDTLFTVRVLLQVLLITGALGLVFAFIYTMR